MFQCNLYIKFLLKKEKLFRTESVLKNELYWSGQSVQSYTKDLDQSNPLKVKGKILKRFKIGPTVYLRDHLDPNLKSVLAIGLTIVFNY